MYPRVQGEYALSPATAAPVVTLARTVFHQRADWLVNLRTLVRNYVESFEETEYYNLSANSIAYGLVDEVNNLRAVLAEVAPSVTLRIYYPNYRGIKHKYPYAIHREATTEKAKAKEKQVAELIRITQGKFVVEPTDCNLPMITSNAIVTTHYPADLLAKRGHGTLDLLESYTGTLKDKSKWSSKLTGSDRAEVAALPFNKLTVQLFGDQSSQFKSAPKKMKEEILELAKKKDWSTLSSDEYIGVCLNSLFDPIAKKLFRDMLL